MSAAGRAHEPSGLARRDLARGVPDALEEDAAGKLELRVKGSGFSV